MSLLLGVFLEKIGTSRVGTSRIPPVGLGCAIVGKPITPKRLKIVKGYVGL